MRKILGILLFACLLAACATPPSTRSIAGSWMVTDAEHEGRPLNSVVGGTLTISGEEFKIRTVGGSELRGRIQVNAKKIPHELDFIHIGGVSEGARWLAIYQINADTLRLNYVDAKGKEPRPSRFATSSDTEASLMALRRVGQ